jgi:hypothetical protein
LKDTVEDLIEEVKDILTSSSETADSLEAIDELFDMFT